MIVDLMIEEDRGDVLEVLRNPNLLLLHLN